MSLVIRTLAGRQRQHLIVMLRGFYQYLAGLEQLWSSFEEVMREG